MMLSVNVFIGLICIFNLTYVNADIAHAPSQTTVSEDFYTCYQKHPNEAFISTAPLANALLRALESNPPLQKIFNVNVTPGAFYNAIISEFHKNNPIRARMAAGSMDLLIQATYYRITPLVNMLSVTDALDDFTEERVVITPKNIGYFVTAFVNSLKHALRYITEDSDSIAYAFVRGIDDFLGHIERIRPYNFHQFISYLAARYFNALYAHCKPKNFSDVYKVQSLV